MGTATFYNGKKFTTDETGHCRAYVVEVWRNGSLDEKNDVFAFTDRGRMQYQINKIRRHTFDRGIDCKAFMYITKDNGKYWHPFEYSSYGFRT